MLGVGGADQGRRMEGVVGTGAVVLEYGTWTEMPIYLCQEEIQGTYQMYRYYCSRKWIGECTYPSLLCDLRLTCIRHC